MASIPEQLAEATKAHFEAQLGLINELTRTTVEGVEKIIALNVDLTKSSLDEVSEAVKKTGAVIDPQELLTEAVEKAGPNTGKALDYSRQLAEIAASMQAELAKATESQVIETTRTLTGLIDEVSKSAPPGSENTIATMKTIIDNANAGYEQLLKNARLAGETLQARVDAATTQLNQAIDQAAQKGAADSASASSPRHH